MKLATCSAIALIAAFGTWGCAARNGVEVRQLSTLPVARATSPAMVEGRMLYGRGEYALAIDAFRKAIRENPEAAEGYNALASAYDMIGRFDLARTNYELALARAPSDGRIFRNMARSLSMQGRNDEASELLAEWNAIDVKDAVAAQDGPPAPARGAQASVAAPPAAQTAVAAELPVPAPMTMAARPAESVPVAPARGPEVVIALDPPRAPQIAAAPVAANVPAVRTARSTPTLAAAPTIKLALDAPPPVRRVALAAIRILNAGSTKGAARKMQTLLARGGTPAVIGDANRRFAQSWIVYPKSARAEALRLQHRLPFRVLAIADNRVDRVTLLIGRNSAPARAVNQRG